MLKKIQERYEGMSLPVRMAFWYLVCSFFQKAIGMVSTPIFTRVMTESEYGRFGVYSSWYSIISVVATLSISGNCFTRALVVTEDDSKRSELSSALLGLVVTLILLFSLLYYAHRELVNQITGLNSYLFLMMQIDLLMITACQFWTNSKRVNYQYRGIVILTLSYTIARPTIALFAVIHAPEWAQVEARVTGVAITNILQFLWIYIYIFSKGKRFFDKEAWKYGLAFCIPLIPHYLSKSILNESDRIMISKICGTSYAGYYSVAYTIAAIMMIFNTAVAQSLDPWIYKSIKNKTLDRIGPVSYRLITVIALLNVCVMGIAPEVLMIMAPANYSQALWAIPPVTASVFFTFMYDLFASFQFYFKKTKLIALGSCIGAILNIVLNAIFLPRFGFIVAGYTTLVCYILFGVLHYLFMKKTCEQYLDGYRVYNPVIVFGIGVCLVLCSFCMLILYRNTTLRYVVLIGVLSLVLFFRNTIISTIRSIRT